MLRNPQKGEGWIEPFTFFFSWLNQLIIQSFASNLSIVTSFFEPPLSLMSEQYRVLAHGDDVRSVRRGASHVIFGSLTFLSLGLAMLCFSKPILRCDKKTISLAERGGRSIKLVARPVARGQVLCQESVRPL